MELMGLLKTNLHQLPEDFLCFLIYVHLLDLHLMSADPSYSAI